MEDHVLTRLKRMQALAATGRFYAKDPFDVERYEEIDALAQQLMAAKFSVHGLSDLPLPSEGYATPKLEVRGAVFSEGKILLIRERHDGLWSLPGGFCDVGLSAAENIEKEVWEEANIRVRATRLIQIWHKAKGPYPPDHRDFYKLGFLCEAEGNVVPTPGEEAIEVGFFGLDALPDLSACRISRRDIESAFQHHATPQSEAEFDRTC
ncbi:MAG: NUDIX hydrolase [Pseudoruegeria sp.]